MANVLNRQDKEDGGFLLALLFMGVFAAVVGSLVLYFLGWEDAPWWVCLPFGSALFWGLHRWGPGLLKKFEQPSS